MKRHEFTITHVARMCGVAPNTVQWWIKRGHITRTRRGKIDGVSLIAYLERRGDRGQHIRSRLQRQYCLRNDGEDGG